jgi:lipoate-protein ligase B
MPGQLTVVPLRRMSYDDALAEQVRLRDAVIASDDGACYLMLVEHEPTVTIGIRGDEADLRLDEAGLAERGVVVRHTNRGGQVTFHGPGQLVAYPILDLRPRGRNLHGYLRALETWLVDVCHSYGLAAHADSPHTGVWIEDRKIASIGIAARRWVSYHGVALNVSSQMSFFDLIVPCGMQSVTMTSMERELGAAPPLPEVAERAAVLFAEQFELEM